MGLPDLRLLGLQRPQARCHHRAAGLGHDGPGRDAGRSFLGAAGIIGSEDNLLNMLFFGVLAVGFVGAFIAHFRPRGMARAIVAMGVVQVLAAVPALIGGHFTIVLTGFFVAAWFMSAWHFRKAAEDQAAAQTTG